MTGMELEMLMKAGERMSSVVPALVQGAVGVGQLIKGKRMEKNLVRPEMSIPDAAKQQLNIAQNLASSYYMAGQGAAEQALNQQYAGTAQNVMNTASSSAEALGALVGANANRMGAQTQLAGQAEQSYIQRQQNYQNELANMAEWQQDAWTQNVWNKYVGDANKAASLIQAGSTNAFNAMKTVYGVGASFMADMNTPENREAILKRQQERREKKLEEDRKKTQASATTVNNSNPLRPTPTSGSGMYSVFNSNPKSYLEE